MTSRPVSPPPYLPARRPATSGLVWLLRLPLLGFMAAFLLMVAGVTFLFALQVRFQERILPNVYALGVPLGDMTVQEARSALIGRFSFGEQTVFTFRDGDKFWQMSAQELGVGFDVDATVAAAYALGHSDNVLRNLLEQARVWFEGANIAPVVTYNQATALAKLNDIAASINRPAQNATLALDGLRVRQTEGQNGRTLDVWATLQRFETQLLTLRGGAEIALVVNETPPLVYSVAQAASQIERALSAPVRLVANDENGAPLGPWTATPQQIAALLRVELVSNPDGTQAYAVKIDTQAFETYLQTLAPGLVMPARDARFRFNETTRQLEVIQPAQSGRTLNVSETLKRLEEGILSEDARVVPMAFDLTLPRYHNQVTAESLGIRELVATATTYFSGSDANRRTNIALAASRFDGIIVAPNEEFSFNYYLGEISEEGGFVQGLVIYGDRTVIGVGGGACQVSTTIFRAAFSGGFAITERNSHGYRVGYYELNGSPPGLDAAIWQPERDFRFQNNTPYHLLINVNLYPAQSALEFNIYSTKHWRAVIQPAIIKNVTPPRPPRYEVNRNLRPGEIIQVDYAAEGADVTIYREIYDLQGNLVRKDYEYTHYLPWGAVYQVAAGDSRLTSGGR